MYGYWSNIFAGYRLTGAINLAGYTGKTNVDDCETDRANCLAGNAVLPGIVAEACSAIDIAWGMSRPAASSLVDAVMEPDSPRAMYPILRSAKIIAAFIQVPRRSAKKFWHRRKKTAIYGDCGFLSQASIVRELPLQAHQVLQIA